MDVDTDNSIYTSPALQMLACRNEAMNDKKSVRETHPKLSVVPSK
jgi:hypothetical protein